MNKSLTETYMTTRNSIDAKIVKIQALLKELDEDQDQEPKNWAYAGTAIHIDSQLDSAIDSLEN